VRSLGVSHQEKTATIAGLVALAGDSGVTQDALFRLAGGVTAAKGQNAPRAFLKGT
jgi:hypothetical protein